MAPVKLPGGAPPRTFILLIAGLGALAYALIPPGNPVWLGIAGSLLGFEPLYRSRPNGEHPPPPPPPAPPTRPPAEPPEGEP